MIKKLVDITSLEYSHGYFFIISNPRSGHNFIKNNILSWTDDIEKNKRYYVNLEGFQPIDFDIYTSEVDLTMYNDSIKVLVLRSLLNWFTSISMVLSLPINTNILETHEKYKDIIEKSIIVHRSELAGLSNEKYDPKNDPEIIIIPDSLKKEDFISLRTEKKDVSYKLSKALDRWLTLAKEFMHETTYLNGFINVYYDMFFQSQDYRKNICQQINGTYNEDVLNVVTPEGGYSSIDKNSFQNDAQNMKVLERWKQWEMSENNQVYTQLLKSHPALDYYLNNFDVSEEEKNFINSI